jgi:hypothetical protein
MKDSIKIKLSKLEQKLRMNKNFILVIHQINENTLKYRDKLYEIPTGMNVSEYLRKKFPDNKIILDDIL